MARDPSVFVHPQALCESQNVGANTRIWAFAHVMADAVVGSECNVCDHAFIESGAVIGDGVTLKNNVLIWDGVTIEDEVFVGPNVVFTNDLRPRAAFKRSREEFLLPTRVQRGASLGANSTIVCGVTIGHHAMVGAGAVVISDVRPFALVVGNPARHIGWVCMCGEHLTDGLVCRCGRRYSVGGYGVMPAGRDG